MRGEGDLVTASRLAERTMLELAKEALDAVLADEDSLVVTAKKNAYIRAMRAYEYARDRVLELHRRNTRW